MSLILDKLSAMVGVIGPDYQGEIGCYNTMGKEECICNTEDP